MRPFGGLGWVDIQGPPQPIFLQDDTCEIGKGVVLRASDSCLGAHVILHQNVIIGQIAWFYEDIEIGPDIDLTGIPRLTHIHWWKDLP